MRLSELAILGACLLQGCSTYSTSRYSISADNVVALRAYRGQTISVGEFSAKEPGKAEITCRGVGPIRTPDGEPFSEYVRKAFIDELKMAEVYAKTAPFVLTGSLDVIDFDSQGDPGTRGGPAVIAEAPREPVPPHWLLSLVVRSSNGKEVSVTEKYSFASNYVGEVACNQTALAFMPAVQNLVQKLIGHPQFASLVGR